MRNKSIMLFAVIAALTAGNAFALRATDPVEPTGNWQKTWWPKRFAEKLELAKAGGAPVVFLGDSITHNWERHGKDVWAKHFADGELRALYLGVGADRTEHVLWRIDHGHFDGYEAKAIVLMIGTNNTGHFPLAKEKPEDTVEGIKAIIDRLRAKQPGAKIILSAIFPRGEKPDDKNRLRNNTVNGEIRKLADGKNVIWFDINDKFLNADGTLPKEMFPDFLHPRKAGYEIWAAEIIPLLKDAVQKK